MRHPSCPAVLAALAASLAACSDEGGAAQRRDAGFDGDGGPRFEAVQIPSLPTPEPNFFGVWGSSDTDVFIAGERGTIAHWDGTTWTVQPTPVTADLRAIWGWGDDPLTQEVWAVGNAGTVLHYTPAAGWQVEASTTTKDLHAVSGNGERVFAAGVDGAMITLDRTAEPALRGWILDDAGTLETLHDLRIFDGSSGLAVGNLGAIVRWDGSRWSRRRVDGLVVPLAGLWGQSIDDFWIVGLDGTILRFSGGDLTEVEGAPLVYLRKVAGLGGDEVFVTGWGGTIAHATAEGAEGLAAFSDHRLEGIWGTAIETPLPDDAGVEIQPRYYVVGVTGTVLIGP